MTTVRFTDEPHSDWVKIAFPYDAELVAMVKDVSRGVREYDPATKAWRVLDEVAVRLAEEMTKAGHLVLHGDEPAPAPKPPKADPSLGSFFGIDSTTDAYDVKLAASQIIASIPGQHVHKVFRAVAKLLYPDMYKR